MWSDQLTRRIRRRYLDVVEAIETGIEAGEFANGSRLPSDREISQKLGVSRPTAREALLALEFAGLIEIRPGSGTYVTRPDVSGANGVNLMDSPALLLEARIALEPAIARLCASRLSSDRLKVLKADLRLAAAETGPNGSPTELVRLGLEFHKHLSAGCENAILASLCGSLVSVNDHPLWTLLNRQAMLTVKARKTQVDAHRTILEAIATGDADGAYQAMRTHLDRLSTLLVGFV